MKGPDGDTTWDVCGTSTFRCRGMPMQAFPRKWSPELAPLRGTTGYKGGGSNYMSNILFLSWSQMWYSLSPPWMEGRPGQDATLQFLLKIRGSNSMCCKQVLSTSSDRRRGSLSVTELWSTWLVFGELSTVTYFYQFLVLFDASKILFGAWIVIE